MEILLENSSKFSQATAIISTAGAELRSCKIDGKEIIWKGDPAYWGKTSPFLFPMVGRLKGGKTVIDGVEYTIGKHGFARDMEFSAVKTSDNTATMTLKSNEKTLACYPFEFTLNMHYRLLENGIEILYEVKNESSKTMLYCIGAHPAIACADIEKCSLVFEQPETVNSPVLNAETGNFKSDVRVKRLENEKKFKLHYNDFDDDCVYFDTIKSKSVTLESEAGNNIKVSFDGFETLGVWTPSSKRAPFICIEPWCGCDDFDNSSGIFSEKQGIQALETGKTNYYTLLIERV